MSSLHDAGGLAVRRLHLAFGPLVVLDGIDLHVEREQVVLLTGTNGSGKTTLLRCVAGLVRHTGDVLVDGRSAAAARARGELGYLPQSPSLPAWATGAEVLDLFARLRGETSLPSVLPDGFLPPLDRRIAHLSGGMRQRIALAVALLGSPRVLLLDEPAASLDDEGRLGLASILDAVRAGGSCVLVTAPSPADLAGVADHIVRITEGRLIAAEPPADVDRAHDGGRVHRLVPRAAREVTP